MGCRLLHDRSLGYACWYDSVTDTAFGPVFLNGAEEAEDFGKWLDANRSQIIWAEYAMGKRHWASDQEVDPRGVLNLTALYDRYLFDSIDDEGVWRPIMPTEGGDPNV